MFVEGRRGGARARIVRECGARGLPCALAVIAAAGCGVGAGKAPSGVQLTVTRDFGTASLGSWSAPRVRGAETVMSLLVRNAGATRVHGGERIWWDRHDWSLTDHIPAVVGSFPEPFRHGIGGKRLPVRVECEAVAGVACRTVVARLRGRGVPAAVAAPGSGAEPRTLRVLVAPWARIARDPLASAIAGGPAASGVYARFAPGGRALVLLDAGGGAARTLGAGAGLIAATGRREDAPVWVVTGTDPAGVQRAAGMLSEPVLRDRFAVALPASGGKPIPLPEVSR